MLASLVHADFVQAALGRDGVFHVSHDSSAIDAREKGQRKPQTDEEKAMIPMMQKVSENFNYFYDLADAGYDAAEIRQKIWKPSTPRFCNYLCF